MGHLYDATVKKLRDESAGEVLKYALRREMEYKAALHTFYNKLSIIIKESYPDYAGNVNVDIIGVDSIDGYACASIFVKMRWIGMNLLKRLQDVASGEGFVIGTIRYDLERDGLIINFCVNGDETYNVGGGDRE